MSTHPPLTIAEADRPRTSGKHAKRRSTQSRTHGHSFGDVHIDGNATVHLGDFNTKETRETRQKRDPAGSSVKRVLDLASVLLEIVFRAAPIIERHTGVSTNAISIDIDHSLISTALTAFRESAKHLRTKNLGTADRLIVTKQHFAEAVFDLATSPAIPLAETLATGFEDLLLYGVGKKFATFQEAISRVVDPTQLALQTSNLDRIREHIVLSIALLLSSNTFVAALREAAHHGYHTTLIGVLLEVEPLIDVPLKEIKERFDPDLLPPGQIPPGQTERLSQVWEWFSRYKSVVLPILAKVETAMATARASQIRKIILNSLAFPEMDARYHEISEAQAATFGWIFESEATEDRPKSPFAEWLRSQDCTQGLFWISGKPGSGKSTLMRFLADDDRTRKLAKSWADSGLVIVKSFFWSPGTWLQKSQQGLLRSILHQLLILQPLFSQEIFPHCWSHLQLLPQHEIVHRTPELESAIFSAVRQLSFKSKILLVIDGLDEYHAEEKSREHEERQAICDLLQRLALQDCVKVCSSSRPWNVYSNAFHQQPYLRLEELTRPDIRKYVLETFNSSARFKEWLAESPEESEAFVEDFITRARGVFLWVCLVAKSLLKGLQNLDDMQDLTKRLEKIPTSLKKYFHQIISNLDDEYLEPASRIFKIALSGPPQLLMLYHFMGKHAMQRAMQSKPDLFTLQAVVNAQKREEIRVNARCMGFLEPVDAQIIDKSHKPGVQVLDFLHRTARDFMLSEEMQERVRHWGKKDEIDINKEHARGVLCILRTCDRKSPWLTKSARIKLIETLLQSTFNAHHSRDKELWCLLSEIRSAYVEFPDVLVDPQFLLIQTLSDHHPYAEFLISTWSRLQTPRSKRPWLDIALNSDKAFGECKDDHSYWSGTSLAIIQRLLDLGADPNEIFERETIWTRFLERNISAKGRQASFRASMKVMKMMIRAGAVSDVHTANYVKYGGAPSLFGQSVKGPDPYRAMDTLFSKRKAGQLHDLLDKSDQGRQKKSKSRSFFSLR